MENISAHIEGGNNPRATGNWSQAGSPIPAGATWQQQVLREPVFWLLSKNPFTHWSRGKEHLTQAEGWVLILPGVRHWFKSSPLQASVYEFVRQFPPCFPSRAKTRIIKQGKRGKPWGEWNDGDHLSNEGLGGSLLRKPLAVWTFQKPQHAHHRILSKGVRQYPSPPSPPPQLNPQRRPGACLPSPPGLLRGTPGPPEQPWLPSPSSDRWPSPPTLPGEERGWRGVPAAILSPGPRNAFRPARPQPRASWVCATRAPRGHSPPAALRSSGQLRASRRERGGAGRGGYGGRDSCRSTTWPPAGAVLLPSLVAASRAQAQPGSRRPAEKAGRLGVGWLSLYRRGCFRGALPFVRLHSHRGF